MTTTPDAGNSEPLQPRRRVVNPMLIAVVVLAIAVSVLAFYVYQLQRSMSQRLATAEVEKTAAPAQETILAGPTPAKLTADQIVSKIIEAQTAGDDAMVEQVRLQLDALPKALRGERKAARSLNDAGLKALQDGDTALAIRTFSEAKKRDASDPEIANNLAHALVQENQLAEASVAIIESLQLNSIRSAAWGTLGLIYAKTGSPGRASASFQIAFRYSRSSQATVSYLQNLVESDTDANVRQAASLAMQSKPVSDWTATQQIEQSPTLSDGFPLRTDRAAKFFPVDKLPPSFTWLGNIPFGVSERQFSAAFKGSKCFDFDGHRTCSLEHLSVKCLDGINSSCNNLLVGFDTRGLKSVNAKYLSRDEFLEFLKSLIASFGEGEQKGFDARPQVNLRGVIVKWKIDGLKLEVTMNEGVDFSGEYFRFHLFDVTRE